MNSELGEPSGCIIIRSSNQAGSALPAHGFTHRSRAGIAPWLVDGGASIEDLAETVDIKLDGGQRDYSTVSGLVLARLERIPATGDITHWQGLTIEVVDMDGRRIDKVLIRK